MATVRETDITAGDLPAGLFSSYVCKFSRVK